METRSTSFCQLQAIFTHTSECCTQNWATAVHKTGGAPRNSIPGSDSQSTVAYLGPLYDKVVGVAIYSIHILYYTVNIIFGQN